jgi:hypothetical protein
MAPNGTISDPISASKRASSVWFLHTHGPEVTMGPTGQGRGSRSLDAGQHGVIADRTGVGGAAAKGLDVVPAGPRDAADLDLRLRPEAVRDRDGSVCHPIAKLGTATIDKAIDLLGEAADRGATLVVFATGPRPAQSGVVAGSEHAAGPERHPFRRLALRVDQHRGLVVVGVPVDPSSFIVSETDKPRERSVQPRIARQPEVAEHFEVRQHIADVPGGEPELEPGRGGLGVAISHRVIGIGRVGRQQELTPSQDCALFPIGPARLGNGGQSSQRLDRSPGTRSTLVASARKAASRSVRVPSFDALAEDVPSRPLGGRADDRVVDVPEPDQCVHEVAVETVNDRRWRRRAFRGH